MGQIIWSGGCLFHFYQGRCRRAFHGNSESHLQQRFHTVVAIGGIKEKNILSLKGTGVAGAAIVSGIFARKNIREACVRLRSLAKEMVEE